MKVDSIVSQVAVPVRASTASIRAGIIAALSAQFKNPERGGK